MDKFEEDFQMIYDTMTGNLRREFRISWVKNAWEEDTGYKRAYADFWTAREHLCERFGIEWEDDDLELFMNGVLEVQEDLCRRMFYSTLEYIKRGKEL